jgi:predicted dehydrogenase
MPLSLIRAGIVGAGFAAVYHVECVRKLTSLGAEVAGVYSLRPESREAFGKKWNIPIYDSLESLLDQVDVVHVCAPPAVHEKITVQALQRGLHVIVEKPFTGYFGPPDKADFMGNHYPKEIMLREALASAQRMRDAEAASRGNIYYAENWVFAPVIQKEVDILTKSKGQILWIRAEESHSGSHSPVYGIWSFAGGGSIVGKGTHPLTAALYLKRVEGNTRNGRPIRPQSVSARVHEITRLPSYQDLGFLRTDYKDIEDVGVVHITFEDGTIADIFSGEIVMGGIYCWMEVMANNHRTRCNISHIDAVETYNPKEEIYKDVYLVEKIGTKQGWSKAAPDENWMNGYVQEMEHFYHCMKDGQTSFSNSELAFDTVATIYSAYLSAEKKGTEVEIPCK